MGIYENVKKAAKMRKISINQLEKKLSLPRSSIAKYNSNIPSADKVFTLAQFLNVSVEFLMTGKDADYTVSPEEYTIISAYRELSQDKKETILDILHINMDVAEEDAFTA